MIRNAVLHLNNEQPLVADLFAMPTATDVGLPCTNLRTLSGERPIFADQIGSFFLFPLSHIRFVEVHSTVSAETNGQGITDSASREAIEAPQPDDELAIDEDFLRRVREA